MFILCIGVRLLRLRRKQMRLIDKSEVLGKDCKYAQKDNDGWFYCYHPNCPNDKHVYCAPNEPHSCGEKGENKWD